MQDPHPQDLNLTSQATLVPIQATVSTVITHMDNSTHEAELRPVQVEASGLAWGQEVCWDIFLAREASPTTTTPPLTLTADPLLLEAHPLPLGHALLQVLEEPREDKLWRWTDSLQWTTLANETGAVRTDELPA